MKDPALRSCSVAARGFWMDMLCLMFESDRRGFLQAPSGKPYSHEQLARMTGCLPDEVSRLLAELESSGVFSRTKHGTIFSRRQKRDEEQRADHRARQEKYHKSLKEKENADADMTHDMTHLSHPSSSSTSSSTSEQRGQPAPPAKTLPDLRPFARPVNPEAGEAMISAAWLFTELASPSDHATRDVACQVIRLLAPKHGGIEGAAKFLLAAMQKARVAGNVKPWRWWLADEEYDPAKAAATGKQSRPALTQPGARKPAALEAFALNVDGKYGGFGGLSPQAMVDQAQQDGMFIGSDIEPGDVVQEIARWRDIHASIGAPKGMKQ